MIESILINKKITYRTRITIKSLISFGLIILAVTLPLLAHVVIKNQAGIRFLPMYFPVILGGCLLGSFYGITIGIFSPLASYLFTSLITGNIMPTLERLPFMVVELAIIGLISGLFAKKIASNAFFSFIAVALAFIIGRLSFLGLVYLFQNIVSFSPLLILNQIKIGLIGCAIQLILVPVLLIVFQNRVIKK